MTANGKRFVMVIVGVIGVFTIGALAGLYALEREAKARIADALSPIGSAERIEVGLSSVRLIHVRLHAPPGWPAADTLRADQIRIEPDLSDLIRKRLHVRNIVVDGFDMSVLRTTSGNLQVVPNLQQSISHAPAVTSEAPSQQRDRLIDHIEFTRGTFEFFDETVRHPAYNIKIENAHASIDHLHLPALAEPTTIAVNGNIKGPEHTGTVSFSGWIRMANKDSQTNTQLHGVDIVMLQPYLLHKVSAKVPVGGGTLDMTVDATVRDLQLHALGVVTLNHLQLAESDDPRDTFLSLPAKIAVAALKQHGEHITLHFELDGNLRDPKFSLNESLATKLSASFAQALGVDVQGIAKGVEQTLKGLGGALRNLLGQ